MLQSYRFCGPWPPFPLGERNALLIRSVKSTFAFTFDESNKAFESWK